MLRLLIIALLAVAAVLLLRALYRGRPKEPAGRQPPKPLAKDSGAVTAELEGQEIDIDPAVLEEIRTLAAGGETIEAVKRLREATGIGLTEAKEIVDSLRRMRSQGSA